MALKLKLDEATKTFWFILIGALAPLLGLSIGSTLTGYDGDASLWLWLTALGLCGLYLIVGFLFFVMRKDSLGSGFMAAFGIGCVAQFVTCAVNIDRSLNG